MTDENGGVTRRGFLRSAAIGAGTTGAVAGQATAQEQTTTAAGDGGGETVRVEAGDYYFRPGTDETLYITPGTTVRWEFVTDGHNIHVDSQPSGANWEGHEPIEDTGFTYEHTFEVKGEYHYWCVPHKPLGMIADIVVNDSGEPPSGGPTSVLPDSARTLGVAATGALVSVLGLAYVFLKYGGDTE